MKRWQLLAVFVASLACAGLSTNIDGQAKSTPKKNSGKDIYMQSCEACHMMGKNVIKPGKDIVTSTRLASLEEFKSFLSESHGIMPNFRQIAESPEVVAALYKFAKKLKNQNWDYVDKIEKAPPEPSNPPPKKWGEGNQKPTG